jgi:hypothetical protein
MEGFDILTGVERLLLAGDGLEPKYDILSTLELLYVCLWLSVSRNTVSGLATYQHQWGGVTLGLGPAA